MKRQLFTIQNTYTYDNLGCLASMHSEDGQEVSFTYDAAWNRTAVTVRAAAKQPASGKDPGQSSQQQTFIDAAKGESVTPVDETLIDSRPALLEIIVLSGDLENQRFSVTDKMGLGRETDNDLVLKDQKVSRHHAIIQRTGSIYQIVDQNSGNGTYVNGKRISEPTFLRHDDLVLIGDTKLKIHFPS